MCAEEFASFLSDAKKSPIEEKIDAFGEIVEKIMAIVLRIPDLVDTTLAGIHQQITGLESRVNAMNSDISAIKARGALPAGPAAPGAPGGPPPLGGPPGGPPPPPGGPPGGPPPPPGGPPGGSPPPPGGSPGGPPPPGGPPGGGRPASPVSLRGAIMGELKSLFAKRRKVS